MTNAANPYRRLPAEWEAQEFVQLTFPHANSDWEEDLDLVTPCFVEIATQIARFQRVVVVCQDKNATQKLLSAIPTDRLTLVEIDSNDTWARDHAAITVFQTQANHTEKIHLDFTFNGWGNKFEASKDNQITRNLSNENILKGKVEVVDFVLEGGSVESDGEGTLLTTEECMLSKERNPQYTKAQIEEKLKTFFGVSHILWLSEGALEGDDTDAHIDTLARLCPNDTICYVEPPVDKTDSHFESLFNMEKQLQDLRTKEGKPFMLIALPFAKAAYHSQDNHRLPATYANFLIINNAVLVPTYQDKVKDELALSQIQKAFPDREIIGIDCLPIIRQHGSLHCLTMQFPK